MDSNTINVTFYPGGRAVKMNDIIFIEAAARAGFVMNTPCGGSGTCGKCLARFDMNPPSPTPTECKVISSEKLSEGWRLACQVRLEDDAVVYVPPTSVFGGNHQIQISSDHDKKRVADGIFRKVQVEMAPPSMQDDLPDLARLENAVKEILPDWNEKQQALTASPGMLRRLSGKLRETNFKGTAILQDNRLIEFHSVESVEPLYSVAFDIGTTTLVGALLDMETGEEQCVLSAMNPQTVYGDDVLSRIAYASRDDTALEELRSSILEAIRGMIRVLCSDAGVSEGRICNAVFAGNTTMQHLLCGFSPAALGMVPFVPLHKRGITMDGKSFGLELHPEALAHIFPVIGGFVGGDTVSGLLACEIFDMKGPVLVVDIGTNGEIVLFHEGKLCAASTAAGPAFEGARISCGMRAANGAIEQVNSGDDLFMNVIGNVSPVGLCGSGLIDLCGELLKMGVIRSDGRMLTSDEIPATVPYKIRQRMKRDENGEPVCVLQEKDGRTVALTQRDIRELQLGAGAIRAGIQILLKQAGITAVDLQQVIIAGGFGSFIRRSNAQRIGLIPEDVPHERIVFAGNIAFSGAKWASISQTAQQQAEAIAASVAHVELNNDPDFALEFAMAMQFPGK